MEDLAKTQRPSPDGYSPQKPVLLKMAARLAHQLRITYDVHIQDGEPDRFESERLILRHFTAGDWQDLLNIAVSKERSPFAGCDLPWPTDEQSVRDICGYFAGGTQFWAVEVKDLARVVCFVNFNGPNDQGEMDIGHVMNGEYFGHDYEYEALGVLFDYCFTCQKPPAIISIWPPADEDKVAPLLKLGMRVAGTSIAKKFRAPADGSPVDFESGTLRITAEEWENFR